MATETLETLLPGSMKVGRLLYAEHTDTLIRATGEKPGTRPEAEYVSAAVSDQGLVIADNSVAHLAWIPSEKTVGIRPVLSIPFPVISERAIIPRGLGQEALLELAAPMAERLGTRRAS